MPDRGGPGLSVIIAACDAQATLGRALEAVLAQDLAEPFEVVVVDDGSTDGTAAVASAFGERVRLVRNPSRQGAGRARNRGVAESRGEILAFTDSDCFPTPAWLRAGSAALRRADLVQGAVLPDPAVRRGPFDRTLQVTGDSGYHQTANLLVRRGTFEAAGGFDDSIEGDDGQAARRPVGEDVLFGWRARRQGARVAFAPDALVHHAVFRGSPADWVKGRWRWSRHMPGLAARVPELREHTFYRRWFFDWRSSRFDLALVTALAGLLSRRLWPLAGTIPYGRFLREELGAGETGAPLVFVVSSVAGDAATLAGLVAGSLTWRTLLI
jgi:glycosyltransferase involved in cell wall biosynthesis